MRNRNFNVTLFFIATSLIVFNTFTFTHFLLFRSIVPIVIDGINYTVYVDYIIKTVTNVLLLILLIKKIRREKN